MLALEKTDGDGKSGSVRERPQLRVVKQSVKLSATAGVAESDSLDPVMKPDPKEGGRRPRQRDSAVLYAEARLKLWAEWARDNRGALGLPTISLLFKAMMQKSLKMKVGRASDVKRTEGPEFTARGTETVSFIPPKIGEVPEAIEEVDTIVAALPPDLHAVIVADYFTYGPIEVRCKKTPWRKARYSQLLEAAKYSVFAALQARE